MFLYFPKMALKQQLILKHIYCRIYLENHMEMTIYFGLLSYRYPLTLSKDKLNKAL